MTPFCTHQSSSVPTHRRLAFPAIPCAKIVPDTDCHVGQGFATVVAHGFRSTDALQTAVKTAVQFALQGTALVDSLTSSTDLVVDVTFLSDNLQTLPPISMPAAVVPSAAPPAAAPTPTTTTSSPVVVPTETTLDDTPAPVPTAPTVPTVPAPTPATAPHPQHQCNHRRNHRYPQDPRLISLPS